MTSILAPETQDVRHGRFTGDLLRPLLVVTAVALTAVELAIRPLALPALTFAVFVPVALATLVGLRTWPPGPQWLHIATVGTYTVLSSVLFALAPSTSAPVFAFIAAVAAGEKLASRRAAFTLALTGSLLCAAGLWLAKDLNPQPDEWSWWFGLAVGLPVYGGISKRDRQAALANAERAAAEAERASESEAREAALVERARIAREIHDVLGHSLSSIAIQLDMADALHAGGRDDQANAATRQARALAVSSITETRRAIHALREDTLPLVDTLRLMASGEAVAFEIRGTPHGVPVETAQTVIRVAQEALTNSVKYAPGAARSMTLDFGGSTVSLTVTNEPGTAPHRSDATGSTGMGLVGMRERAALLGGTLHAGPTGTSGGWTVKLTVPQ